MKSIEVSTISVLVFLFLVVTAMQFYKVEPSQTLLAAILLALNVHTGTGSGTSGPKAA